MPPREFFSPRFHYTFGPHEPSISLESGERLRVICPDSDNELSGGKLLSAEQRACDPQGGLFEGNPMAGPIYVREARPGDVLAVTIESIELDRPTGQTGLAPGHGLLPAHQLCDLPGAAPPTHLYRWRIDVRAGAAHLENPIGKLPISVRLDPFVGCIGVCPKWGQSISTLFAGDFGGNMDVPAIKPGATLYLPVWHEGALLMMGDIHAAQGHGEIIGGAIETSGKIDCTIHLEKDRSIAGPRISDAQDISAIASDGDLHSAVQQAYASLIQWIVEDFKMNRFDAYNLVSQCGKLTMGNLVTSPYTVAASIPRHALPQIPG